MKLYFKYFSIALRCQMQHKASFWMSLAGQFLTSFSAFLSIYFLMSIINSVNGFSFSEVLICYSVVLMSISLAECFFRGFDAFAGMLGGGEFDRIMVRPRGLIFQVIGSKIDLTRLGRLFQAIAVFVYALYTCEIAWELEKVIVLVLMILSGTAVFAGLFVIYAALCFFTTESLEFMNIFTDGGREFGRYPFGIYGEDILRFLTFCVPLALFQYYPLLYLLGRSDLLLHKLSPIFAFLFLIPCYFIWRIGVRHYKSTGS
ncbi:MAG: ABC-2 family transporter protein [Clostridia bacterium]|nr:ABC-2 family transporter protein [Clostridia bacterium]MBQ6906309.1 ABC-2 family transporter protein [Clostridia bacterium]